MYRRLLAPLLHTLGVLGGTHLGGSLGSCRFHPSCSHYCEEAVRRYGWWRGSCLGVKRLLRCHPFAAGGPDELS